MTSRTICAPLPHFSCSSLCCTQVRGDLTKLNRATLSALVVMDVHARDTTMQLAREGIEGEPGHFSWLSQLRMYWEVRQMLLIRDFADAAAHVSEEMRSRWS